jgi:hypothetical protein
MCTNMKRLFSGVGQHGLGSGWSQVSWSINRLNLSHLINFVLEQMVILRGSTIVLLTKFT